MTRMTTSSPARGLEGWLAAAVFDGEFYRLADELAAAMWPIRQRPAFYLRLLHRAGEAIVDGIAAGIATSWAGLARWMAVEERLSSGRPWFRRLPMNERSLGVYLAMALEDRSARAAAAAVRRYCQNRGFLRRFAAAGEDFDDEDDEDDEE